MLRVRGRAAFTLVELLVVMVVIAVLIGLLLPAVVGAVRTARDAAQTTELDQIGQALTDFRGTHGAFPPSRVALVETGNYSPTYVNNLPGLTAAQKAEILALAPRTVATLRKFWPRLQLSLTGAPLAAGAYYDFNGDGQPSPPVVLRGDECLVWFLGGPARPAGTNGWALSGFSRTAANPFDGSGSRTAPLYEFDAGRLADPDNNGFPSFVDRYGLGRPVVYFGAYEGQGYDPADADVQGEATVVFKPVNTPGYNSNGTLMSPGPNPYTVGDASDGKFHRPSSFQLIVAGPDGLYGGGGWWESNPQANDRLPGAGREADGDNLTNLAGRPLGR